MNFCSNCGKKIEGTNFCSNCGHSNASVVQNTNQTSNNSSLPKDNLGLAGFICGIVGFLCCTYVSIPGLICSIMSLNNIKKGKVEPKNKWMGITGIVLSCLGLVITIINIVQMINGTNQIYNIMKRY